MHIVAAVPTAIARFAGRFFFIATDDSTCMRETTHRSEGMSMTWIMVWLALQLPLGILVGKAIKHGALR